MKRENLINIIIGCCFCLIGLFIFANMAVFYGVDTILLCFSGAITYAGLQQIIESIINKK